VREELGTSPVDLQEQVRRAVRERPRDLDVPSRLSVFGASRLSRVDLDMLAALAEHREVHLWLHHASPALWQTVAAAPPVRRRAEDSIGAALSNPLLGSLSRDVRELQHLLRAHVPDLVDVHHPSPPAGSSLLGRLRDDLAHDRVPPDPPALPADDRSVQVHACHGRTRQVEVLREVVVGLLADDPTLEPRDVLVMCPDVETFAPLLAATFATRGDEVPGGDGTHPAARLRVRVADRALHQANPLLAVLDRLLDLGTARLTATEVLDLAGHPAVARRFGFDDDALERLRDWTAGSGTRWGLHEEHRAGWSLQRVPDGTWRRGLDRVLLGAAVDPGQGMEAATLGGLVPLDDVDSSDIDLAGRFAELLDRLDAAHAALAEARTPTAWAELLETSVLRLAAHDADGAWQELQLRDVLAESLVEPAEAAGRRMWTPPRRRCRSSSCVPCCAGHWPDDRPGRGSGRGPSPCARSCRCGRCRTAWWSCSASTTARSPGRPCGTATTCSPATRRWATATPAARTGSCCWTPSALRASTSSSPTPAPTSARAPPCRRRCRSASCSTRSTGRPPHRPGCGCATW
jgi:exodeoxyribonuclease V gamma subunit